MSRRRRLQFERARLFRALAQLDELRARLEHEEDGNWDDYEMDLVASAASALRERLSDVDEELGSVLT